MTVQFDEVVRTIVRQVGNNGQLYANTFYTQCKEASGVADSTVLAELEDWIEAVFGSINGKVDAGVSFGDCSVDVVEVTGVYDPDPALNTAKVTVVRPVGFITPGIANGATGEEYSGVDTITIIPATNVSKTRARKSLSGFTEAFVDQQLLINALLSDAIFFGVQWVLGPSGLPGIVSEWLAGTLSLRLDLFAAFTGTFTITNVPGTQVTRKIGRGA